MAAFQHNNHQITYEIATAPFADDMLWLQDSGKTREYWRSALQDLAHEPAGGGRIAICDWYQDGLDLETLSEDLSSFIKTLGLQNVRAVACGSAVPIAQRLAKQGVIEKTLLFAQTVPSGAELMRSIREFSET